MSGADLLERLCLITSYAHRRPSRRTPEDAACRGPQPGIAGLLLQSSRGARDSQGQFAEERGGKLQLFNKTLKCCLFQQILADMEAVVEAKTPRQPRFVVGLQNAELTEGQK